MGTTGKRARRRQKAQEWLERGDSHPEQKKNTEMDSEVEMQWRIYGGVRGGQDPPTSHGSAPHLLVHHKCKISYLKFLNKLILLL